MLNNSRQQNSSFHTFNMTPVIDIVFLLIIFFLVVCRFIDAENFQVDVTDACENANVTEHENDPPITLTVMNNMQTPFAVGSDIISDSDYDTSNNIADALNDRLELIPPDRKTVILRIDKDVQFQKAQLALAGIAKSNAQNIRLAVLKNTD